MSWILPALSLAISVVVLVVLLFLLKRTQRDQGDTLGRAIQDEFRTSRQEASRQARELREEIANAQAKADESQMQSLKAWSDAQKQDLTKLRENTEAKLEAVRKTTEDRLTNGERVQRQAVSDLQEAMTKLTETTRAEMTSQRELVQKQLGEIQTANEQRFEKVQVAVGEQLKALGESSRQDQQKADLGEEERFVHAEVSHVLEGVAHLTQARLSQHSSRRRGQGPGLKLRKHELIAVMSGDDSIVPAGPVQRVRQVLYAVHPVIRQEIVCAESLCDARQALGVPEHQRPGPTHEFGQSDQAGRVGEVHGHDEVHISGDEGIHRRGHAGPGVPDPGEGHVTGLAEPGDDLRGELLLGGSQFWV